MILTILSCIIFGIGIAFMVKHMMFKPKYRDVVFGTGVICFSIGLIACCVVVGGIALNYANYDVNYQDAIHEKQVLEYRLKNKDENTIGNELLYNDIVEFNNELRHTKKWANNPWTSWFHNANIASIDYIEIDGLNN